MKKAIGFIVFIALIGAIVLLFQKISSPENVNAQVATPTPAERPLACGIIGDVDNDSKITKNDASMGGQILVGLIPLTDDLRVRADVTGDGNITIDDNLTISRYASGLIPTFPACALITPSPYPDRPLACGSYGDINADGKITESDLLDIRRIITTQPYSDIQKFRADLNGLSGVNSTDSVLMSRYLSGLDSTFPICNIANKPSPCNGYGDINSDNKIDEADIFLAIEFYFGRQTPNTEQARRASVDTNREITMADVNFIQQFSINSIPTFPICSAIPSPTRSPLLPPCGSFGDVDKNGVVEIADSLLVSRFVSGLTDLDQEQRVRADVTADNAITSDDSTEISKYVTGLATSFNACSAPRPLTCDPNADGSITTADYDIWRSEYSSTPAVTNPKSDCFNKDGKVDLLDFQVWKDIAVLKIKQPF